MTTLLFIVPAFGRVALTRVCLRQLARTCDALEHHGIKASAIVVGDDENMDTALELGFATVRRDNKPLGRKFNDGFELACRMGVDFMVPLGSDDWVDPAWVAFSLPADDEVRCSRLFAAVNEDRTRIARMSVNYDGGHGVRVIPRKLVERAGGRPAEEDRARAIDGSILRGLSVANNGRPHLEYVDLHPFQMVDWKSSGQQLNTYAASSPYLEHESDDPFEALEHWYPSAAIDEMRALEVTA